MKKSLCTAALSLVLAGPLPLAAQDTGAAASEEGAQVDEVLDMGTPATNEPKIGSRYLKESFGDWNLVCIVSGQETDPCSLSQILKDEAGGAVAEITLFRLKEGESVAVAGATLIAPLETLLPSGITVSVDGAPGKRYNFSHCTQAGCIAQVGLTEGDIAAFKQGSEAIVSVRPAQARDQVVAVKMSLSGFTAGYDKVDVVEP